MADAKTVQLVQSSWKKVVDSIPGPAVAELFYKNLFESAPGARELFAETNMKTQGVALIGMIDAAVANLDKPDTLIPTLQALGVRHSGYGCIEAHYDIVGAALLKTLSMGLGDAFTAEVKTAWVGVYGVIKSTMWTAQCTPEGKRLYAAWEKKQAAKKAAAKGTGNFQYLAVGVAAAIAGVVLYKFFGSQ